ncbi:MAG: sigma 54-interacting transcriptional regulator [Desulfobacter sp.]|nr:MAG: sigma 54-interacting transcriptional regulator [Desulfobacter sp.]
MVHSDTEFFHQASMKICGSLDSDLMLTQCRRFLKAYLPVDSIVMGFYDHEKRELHRVSRAEPQDDEDMLSDLIYVPEKVAGFFKEKQESLNAVSISNAPADNPAVYEWSRSIGMPEGSFMSMDLSLDNVHIGFITLFSRGFDRYTCEHGRLLFLLHAPFSVALNNVLQHRELANLKDRLRDDNRYLNRQLQRRAGDEIIGGDSGLKKVMKLVDKVASLSSQVLLLGETGVGKEVIANAIHRLSPRSDRPFIKVNCGAIPENLIDSELFGHEKGAFTGAGGRKRGRFERAHTGTLFLDEIGELPLQAQVRLLRVLQNREIERVGGQESISVDIRIIAATHRNLEKMVAEGTFREDLWFRLNVLPITIPPLRERIGDIPDLASYFIRKKAREMNFDHIPAPGPGLIDALRQNPWKGNIREFENTIERAMIRHMGEPQDRPLRLGAPLGDNVEAVIEPGSGETGPFPSLDQATATHIRKAMALTKGRIQGKEGAAAILGIHPSTLRCRMKKLGIPFGRSEKY